MFLLIMARYRLRTIFSKIEQKIGKVEVKPFKIHSCQVEDHIFDCLGPVLGVWVSCENLTPVCWLADMGDHSVFAYYD